MSTKQNLIFFLLILLIGIFFGYPSIITKGPQSTHTWRQSDCAALAKNYYRSNLKFFKPRLFNRQEGEGYMVGEFTGTYFLAAVFYKIFGVHDGFLRGIHLIIFLGGIMALFKLSYYFLGNYFYSGLVALLFFSAPVLTFYGNNFIPDAPAFGFLMMGWAAFMQFNKDKVHKYWWWAAALFALAGLMKITFLMSVGALGLLFLFETLGWLKLEDRKLFPNTLKAIAGFTLILVVVGSWYFFSIQYNKSHDSIYFLNATYPIWAGEDMNYFTFTLFRTFFFWSKYYFFPGMGFLFLFLVPWVFFGKKSPGNFLYGLCLLSFAGAIAIWFLWFYQFTDHDYYIIGLYPFFIFIMLAVFKILVTHYTKLAQSISFRIALVLFLTVNIWYAKQTMTERYQGPMSFNPNPVLSEPEFHDFLTSFGINKDTKVISIPDTSPNITLHRLNLPGFTEWKDTKRNRISVERMQHFIDLGAHFLIVHEEQSLEKDYVKPFTENLAGKYKDVKVYDLSPYFR